MQKLLHANSLQTPIGFRIRGGYEGDREIVNWANKSVG